MKARHIHLSVKQLFFLFGISLVSQLFFSCTAVGLSESPMRYGYGAHIAPGLQMGESNTSVHALFGYDRIGFKGGGGHNNFWQFGGQVRQLFSDKNDNTGFWAGGEATFIAINNKYDNSSVKQTASAFTVGGLAGYRFIVSKLPLSVYIAPAYFHRGKFETNGMEYGSGGNGFLGRVGVDVHFASLLTKKGR